MKGLFCDSKSLGSKPATLSDVTPFHSDSERKKNIIMAHTAEWTSAIFLLNIVDTVSSCEVISNEAASKGQRT